MNALLYDPDLTTRLREDFLGDSRRSLVLDYAQFKERPWLQKLAEGAARTISPLL